MQGPSFKTLAIVTVMIVWSIVGGLFANTKTAIGKETKDENN